MKSGRRVLSGTLALVLVGLGLMWSFTEQQACDQINQADNIDMRFHWIPSSCDGFMIAGSCHGVIA